MQLQQDFSRAVVINTLQLPWQDSPEQGVRRRLLERDGGEVARATSVVSYAPGCSYSRHTHELGEEFVVLSGEFHDEHGAYPAGTYVRNPPGSSHAPFSQDGCTLFVKLRGLQLDDRQRVVRNLLRDDWHPGGAPGLSVMPLAGHGTEHTAFVRWHPGTRFVPHRHHGGEEIYVLDGVFSDDKGNYPAGTWLRSPHLSAHHPFSASGCTIFVKTGHLPTGE
jgi:anti-sigma factor ChrR (cupin superfamily)